VALSGHASATPDRQKPMSFRREKIRKEAFGAAIRQVARRRRENVTVVVREVLHQGGEVLRR
jgi:hypothetical protein